jgi:hypothetical protein
MEHEIADLTALIAVVITLGFAYAKGFGAYQTQLVEWVIAAAAIGPRWRGLLNLAVGTVLALLFTAIAAYQLDDWSLIAVGLFAGILASIEAARVHDDQEDEPRASRRLR